MLLRERYEWSVTENLEKENMKIVIIVNSTPAVPAEFPVAAGSGFLQKSLQDRRKAIEVYTGTMRSGQKI